MKIIFNSQDENFKKPFGALKCKDTVALKIKAEDFSRECFVRLWFDKRETIIPMIKCGNIFSLEFKMSDTPQLLWYYFIFKTEGETFFLSKSGICLKNPDTDSFQITVYDKDFETPEWFQNSVMYQIFPDRFYRKGDFLEKRHDEYYFHKSFDEPLLDLPHPFERGPALCDFYGGNLNGISEKLSYLSELGISVIYLNPIFEAYSNHRYDTGNYKKIDSLLGTEEDFQALCKDAEALGIRFSA